MSDNKPSLWVFCGPNGTGKSTHVLNLLANIGLSDDYLVNPDIIAATLNPTNRDDPLTVVKAGQIALELRKTYLRERKSFLIETTLSGHSAVRFIKQAKDQGYWVNLVFIGLQTHHLSNARVYTRIQQGGHDVPEDAIARRYPQTLDNLTKVAPFIDQLYLIDNSSEAHRLLLHIKQQEILFLNSKLASWADIIVLKLIAQFSQVAS